MSNNSKESVKLADGIYYTIQGLMEKYDASEGMIRKRIGALQSKTADVFGRRVYKDDPRFAKLSTPAGRTDHLQKTENYASLFNRIVRIENKIDEILLCLKGQSSQQLTTMVSLDGELFTRVEDEQSVKS